MHRHKAASSRRSHREAGQRAAKAYVTQTGGLAPPELHSTLTWVVSDDGGVAQAHGNRERGEKALRRAATLADAHATASPRPW